MPTVNYTVVDGEIISEDRDGVERDYVPDALGSTVALMDANGQITDTFKYWPYGEVRARTGVTPTPFQFGGTRGYRMDSASLTYVRARVLDRLLGRWRTQDPVQAAVGLYSYVEGRPTYAIDPLGLSGPSLKPINCFPKDAKDCPRVCKKLYGDDAVWDGTCVYFVVPAGRVIHVFKVCGCLVPAPGGGKKKPKPKPACDPLLVTSCHTQCLPELVTPGPLPGPVAFLICFVKCLAGLASPTSP